jgi:serine protease Do
MSGTHITRAGLCGLCLCSELSLAALGRAAEFDPQAAYDKCAPSVVMITAVQTVPYGFTDRAVDLLDPFPLLDTPSDLVRFVLYPVRLLVVGPVKAGGSGFIIDAEGHVITNQHVIADANLFWATLHDERLVAATLVGSDETEDYALLKLELKKGEKVAPAALGDSDALRLGETVFAIGSPLRLRQSLTVGVVAGLHRRMVGPFQDFVQTDLTIGSGSSGGPLFNARGEVAGMTTLMHAVLEQTGNVTFSVPINTVKEGLPQLKKEGAVTRGFIGVHLKDVTPRVIEEFDLKVKSGACCWDVGTPLWRNSPAADAGLRDGDVIVRWDGAEVDRARTLARKVLTAEPGTTVRVTYVRGESERTCKLTVAER